MTAQSCARETGGGEGGPELLTRGFGDSSVPGPAAPNRIALQGQQRHVPVAMPFFSAADTS